MKNYSLILLLSFIALSVIAQEKIGENKYYYKCAVDDMVILNLKKNPDIFHEYMIYEKNLKELNEAVQKGIYERSDKTDTLINGRRIIPVVFHVIHKGGIENISKDQIYDAVELLNLDYNKQNADTSDTAPIFKSRAADCQIEFRLAGLDPDGNCTDGIHRVYDPRTDYAQYNVMRDNSWPYSKYMNVYVVSFIYPEGMTLPDGALIGGLSPFTPDNMLSGTNGDTLLDGVLIRHDCIGHIGTAEAFAGIPGYNSQGRVLTHETGHFFNLYHPFQDITALLLGGDGCGLFGLTNGDEVSDTPPVAEATQGCPQLDHNTCSTDSPDEPDMVQNFMDYAGGWCQTLFSQGQLDRINTTLMGTRRNLWSYENLLATGVLDISTVLCSPVADFYQNVYSICEGGSISFTDWSYNGIADSWSWIFTGGTPSVSTDQNPVITYDSAGIYDVTFISINAAGQDTLTKHATVTVNDMDEYIDLPFQEGFETATIDSTWMINNDDGNTWAVTSAAYTGLYSMAINNFTNNARFSIDEIITDAYDLTQIEGVAPRLKFDIAYAGRRDIVSNPIFGTTDTTDLYDVFKIYASTDCGESWAVRYSKIGAALATTGIREDSYTPAIQDEWRQESVSLSGLTDDSNVRFKFYFESKGGNNIFIDNIQIETANSIEDAFFTDFDFSVIPNPVNDVSDINFYLPKNYKVNIEVLDVLGRKVCNIENARLNKGQYHYHINASDMDGKGIYFVNIELDGMLFTKKIIATK